jgi:histone H3/H4
MPKNKNIFAHAILARIIKEETGLRVSKSALPILESQIEMESNAIAKKAIALSDHARRNTILDKDIFTASREKK